MILSKRLNASRRALVPSHRYAPRRPVVAGMDGAVDAFVTKIAL